MKKVLILGSKGMLGQELVQAFKNPHPSPLPKGERVSPLSYEVVAWDREEIDATDFSQLQERITQEQPHVIFNAIAYNAVDLCEESEEEYTKAKMLNVELPRELAKIAKSLHSILVHYSTDYVFNKQTDAESEQTYTEGFCEEDMPHPINRYGQTKYEGELAVAENAEKYYVIRLSKLFGKPAQGEGAKRSFFDVMLEKGREQGSVQVVDGEMSNFTYAPDLARASKELVEANSLPGVYHFSNEGAVTWFEACQELYKQAGLETRVEPVSPDTFPRPAKRPAFSVLKNTKFRKLRPYQEALTEYLEETHENK